MFSSFESGLLTWRRGGLVYLAHNKLDSGHDYLDLKDTLYREMLTASTVSFLQENRNTKEALEMNELLKEPVKNIPALAGNILEIYENSRKSQYISNFDAGRQT